MADIFKGVKAFIAGNGAEAKATLASNGGHIMERWGKTVTHLVFSGGTAQQISKAYENNNIKVVSPEWVKDSLKAGKLLDTEKYFPEGPHLAKNADKAAAKPKKVEPEQREASADLANSEEEEDTTDHLKVATTVTKKTGDNFIESQSPAMVEEKHKRPVKPKEGLKKVPIDLEEESDDGSHEDFFEESKSKPSQKQSAVQKPLTSTSKKDVASQQISQPIVSQPSFREEKKKEEDKAKTKASKPAKDEEEPEDEEEEEPVKEEPKAKAAAKRPLLSKKAPEPVVKPLVASPKKSIFSQEKKKVEKDEPEEEPVKAKAKAKPSEKKAPLNNEVHAEDSEEKPELEEKPKRTPSKKASKKSEKEEVAKVEATPKIAAPKTSKAPKSLLKEAAKPEEPKSQVKPSASQTSKAKETDIAPKKRKRDEIEEAKPTAKKAKKDAEEANGKATPKKAASKKATPKKATPKKAKKDEEDDDDDEEDELVLDDDDEDDMEVSSEGEILEDEIVVKSKKRAREDGDGTENAASPAKKARVTKKLKASDIMSQKFRIVLTNVDATNRSTLSSIIMAKGDAILLDEVDDRATHVVTGDEKRSLKVLFALAKGIPLITSNWILSSVDSDAWPDPLKFRAKAFPGASVDAKLLEGKVVYIGPRTTVPREALATLVTSAGGTLAAAAGGAHIGISGDRPIIGAAKDAAVVKEEWLFDALSEGKLPSTSLAKYKVDE